eukprot:gene3931-4907_t
MDLNFDGIDDIGPGHIPNGVQKLRIGRIYNSNCLYRDGVIPSTVTSFINIWGINPPPQIQNNFLPSGITFLHFSDPSFPLFTFPSLQHLEFLIPMETNTLPLGLEELILESGFIQSIPFPVLPPSLLSLSMEGFHVIYIDSIIPSSIHSSSTDDLFRKVKSKDFSSKQRLISGRHN